MAELFESGRIVDLVLLLVVLEVAALPWLLQRLGSSLRLAQLLPNIAAGAALFIALRLAISGAAWHWIAAAMIAALLAHLYDLNQRINPNR